MVGRFSSTCRGPNTARAWYERNINIWNPAEIATYGPDSMITARAGIQLEGVPYGERGPDCWGVEISCELGVLKAIPGWYLECWACYLIFVYPSPTPQEKAELKKRRSKQG